MSGRILIAEDEAASREMLISLAEVHGYEAVAVTDGIDLLDIVSNSHFDVIITDLMMAGLDGASATEIMKLQGNTIPVIAITALSKTEITLVEDKFTKIYHKPVNFNELFGYIGSLLNP